MSYEYTYFAFNTDWNASFGALELEFTHNIDRNGKHNSDQFPSFTIVGPKRIRFYGVCLPPPVIFDAGHVFVEYDGGAFPMIVSYNWVGCAPMPVQFSGSGFGRGQEEPYFVELNASRARLEALRAEAVTALQKLYTELDAVWVPPEAKG